MAGVLSSRKGELIIWILSGAVLVTLMVFKIHLHINTTQILEEKSGTVQRLRSLASETAQGLQWELHP